MADFFILILLVGAMWIIGRVAQSLLGLDEKGQAQNKMQNDKHLSKYYDYGHSIGWARGSRPHLHPGSFYDDEKFDFNKMTDEERAAVLAGESDGENEYERWYDNHGP